MKLLFDDSDQHIRGDGAPDLRLHGILAGTQKTLDAQMLLDPFEEQFHLPATLVECRNRQWRQRRIVGQEHQQLARFGVVEPNTPEVLGVVLGDVTSVEANRLIADHTGCSISLGRVHALGIHATFGARHEESARLMQSEEPSKIEISESTEVRFRTETCKECQNCSEFHQRRPQASRYFDI